MMIHMQPPPQPLLQPIVYTSCLKLEAVALTGLTFMVCTWRKVVIPFSPSGNPRTGH